MKSDWLPNVKCVFHFSIPIYTPALEGEHRWGPLQKLPDPLILHYGEWLRIFLNHVHQHFINLYDKRKWTKHVVYVNIREGYK